MKLGLITNNVSVNLVALAAAAMALGGCSFTANPLNQPPSSSNADTNPDGGAPANAPPHALGTITSLQTPVVQEELQQRQVVRAQVSP